MFCDIAEATKKTALKFSAHENKPKKAPKRAATKKKNASDSDEDMFAVSKKKVGWILCHLSKVINPSLILGIEFQLLAGEDEVSI